MLELGGYWNGFPPSVDTLLKTLRSCAVEELVLRKTFNVHPGGCTTILAETSEHTCYVLARVSDTGLISLPRLRNACNPNTGKLRTRNVLNLFPFTMLERIQLCYLDNVSPMLGALYRGPDGPPASSLAYQALLHQRTSGRSVTGPPDLLDVPRAC